MEQLIYRDRRGTASAKWNGLGNKFSRDDLMGLWVADMDFAVPESVRKALAEFVDFGVFGYDFPGDSYFESFINWEKRHHGYEVKKEWIRYSPGVVAAFNWFVELCTNPGDAVIITTPVYYPFMSAAEDQGRVLIKCELKNTNGVYDIDLEDFEKKIIDNNVKAFILCSPHNPVGKVWTEQELKGMLEICRRHGVFVIADEIHHDFAFKGHKHIPAATLGDYDHMLVTLTAPSKTFNLAGLQNAFVIIPDEALRKRFDEYCARIHVTGSNSFAVVATEAAYNGGDMWLEAVLSTVYENYEYIKAELAEKMPKAVLSPLEGTYLAWLDLSGYVTEDELSSYIEDRCGLALDYGSWFGGDAPCHVRINLATSLENIKKAVKALVENI